MSTAFKPTHKITVTTASAIAARMFWLDMAAWESEGTEADALSCHLVSGASCDWTDAAIRGEASDPAIDCDAVRAAYLRLAGAQAAAAADREAAE